MISYSFAKRLSLYYSVYDIPANVWRLVDRAYSWFNIKSSWRNAASEEIHSSNDFSNKFLKKTFSYANIFWRDYFVTLDPCFSFLHLSTIIAFTVLVILYRRTPNFPEAINSWRNCYFLLFISFILKVETLYMLALLLLLNFLSSECYFYLEKKEAYYWLIAFTPLRISSLSLPKRDPRDAVAEGYPSSSSGEGFTSVTKGFKGTCSYI